MRNFDTWDVYFDLDGNPLHGCVQFNIKDGNTVAPVYDSDGVPVANPMLTDIQGRTDIQAFLDTDVVAYFYKYVGPGRFSDVAESSIDTSDVSLWSLQYTVESQDGRTAHVTGQALMGVSTMAALRALDPDSVPVVDGLKAVTLNGYYDGGDCEPVTYVWKPNATAQDDNGGCVKPDSLLTGRWVLVTPTEHCDSRHFGIFGVDSEYDTSDWATRIVQLVNYCNSAGIRPYFRATQARPYFPYSRIVVTSRNPVDVTAGTIFVDREDSSFLGEWDGEPRFLYGNTTLRCTRAKASWNFKDVIGYDEMVLDASTPKATFTDALVTVTVPTAGKTFTDCTIVSDGKLAENTFSGCVLKGGMFTGESLSPTVDDACTIRPRDFHGRMDLWCTLRSQQHDPVLDLEMETLDSSCTLSLDGVHFKDALFDGFVHESAVSVGFESCRGSVTVEASGNFVMNSEDSELVLEVTGTGEAGTGYQPAMNLVDGSVSFASATTYLSTLGVKGTGLTGNQVVVTGGLTMEGANVGVPLTVRGAILASACTLNSNILHYTVAVTAQAMFESCVFGAYYTLTPSVAGTVFRGGWENCFSSIDSPVVLDRTNLDPVDSHHDYVYAGNTGGFIPYETAPATHMYTVHHSAQQSDSDIPTTPYVLTQMVLGGTDADTNGTPNGYIWPRYSQPLFDTVRMFRIGVDSFAVNAQFTVWPAGLESAGATDEYKWNRYHDAHLAAYWKSGYEFGIMPAWNDPADMSQGVEGNPNFFKGSLSYSFNNLPSFSDYTFTMAIRYECLEKRG